jgi:hypothetical protein
MSMIATSNRVQRQAADAAAQILEVLRQQFPGRIGLNCVETAHAIGHKNGITVERLRQRKLLNANIATRRPIYLLTEIARFLAETSEGV